MTSIKGRQLEILVYLLKCKKTTYQQLAQRFEVSRKTIERDIDRLSAMGIPVYCTQGVGGGVHLDEHYQFGRSFFTDTEIHQIVFALKIMDSLAKTPQKHGIIDKLCLIAPELSAVFESDAEQYLSVDLLSEKVDMEPLIYRKIEDCFNREVLAVVNGTLRVAPIGYVLKPDGLYLFCFSDFYQLIKCREIETFEVSDLEFERTFLSYEEYQKSGR
ncbi:MAG: HTH domain-containing protein [Oscillibacter sp.]